METIIYRSQLELEISTEKKGIEILIGTYLSDETLKYRVPKPNEKLVNWHLSLPTHYARKIKPGTILFCIATPETDQLIVMNKCRNMNKASELFDQLVQNLEFGKLKLELTL